MAGWSGDLPSPLMAIFSVCFKILVYSCVTMSWMSDSVKCLLDEYRRRGHSRLRLLHLEDNLMYEYQSFGLCDLYFLAMSRHSLKSSRVSVLAYLRRLENRKDVTVCCRKFQRFILTFCSFGWKKIVNKLHDLYRTDLFKFFVCIHHNYQEHETEIELD